MEEGIVQITNPKGVTKVIVKCITDWSQVQVLSDPPNIAKKVVSVLIRLKKDLPFERPFFVVFMLLSFLQLGRLHCLELIRSDFFYAFSIGLFLYFY